MADIEHHTADNDQFSTSTAELALAARALILARSSLRSDGLPNEILADTPLDMLLAIYVHTAEGTLFATPDIMASTPSPPIVSERWLTALLDMGLIEWAGEGSRRRAQLTAAGMHKVGISLSIVIEQHRQLMDDHRVAAKS